MERDERAQAQAEDEESIRCKNRGQVALGKREQGGQGSGSELLHWAPGKPKDGLWGVGWGGVCV